MAGYLSRVWMAASVAVVESHTDQGFSGLRSLQIRNNRFSSAVFRPFSSLSGADLWIGDEIPRQADESLQKAMYLTCWGQS